MNSHDKTKELDELCRQLNLDQKTSAQMADDIQAGDELLEQLDQTQLPPELKTRIEQIVTEKLLPKQKPLKNYWLRPILAAAAVIIILLGIGTIWTTLKTVPTKTIANKPIAWEQSDLFEDELDLWEVTFSLETDADEIDDIALGDILTLWQETQTDTDNTLGKETNHENYT